MSMFFDFYKFEEEPDNGWYQIIKKPNDRNRKDK